MQAKDRIICALDVDSADRAVQLARTLHDQVGVFKVGLELVNAAGLDIFAKLQDAGAAKIFYDAKLHDIPNTVAGAMHSIGGLGVWCVTAHATGGAAMLCAAVEAGRKAAEATGKARPKILGVTLLTSIGAETLRDQLRVTLPISEYVAHLAKLACDAGCDGVIAAPQEIEVVRAAVSAPNFLIITPGVRPVGADRGDQARVMTPGEAIARGANYLVIGRPIVAAPDPVAAAQAIAAEIEAVGNRK